MLTALKGSNATVLFYGLVVDDQGHPLPDVVVNWSVMRAGAFYPSLGLSTGDKGSSRTDDTGKFSIKNSGTSLSIDSLRKEGYREASYMNRVFGYGMSSEPHQPNQANPQQFLMLRNDSGPVYKKNIHLAFDWDGKNYEFEIGDKDIKETLILIPSRGEIPKNINDLKWKLILKAKNGKVIQAVEGEGPLAPSSGYEEEIVLGQEIGPARVGSDTALFYLKTDAGKYAELRITAYPDRGSKAAMTAILSIRWNSSGGRSFD